MTRNMGSIDRIVRIVLAAVVAVLITAKVLSGTAAVVLGILAAVFVVTGVVGVCPLYIPFKISTRRKS